jgi:diguanylate cyclase (GGDEF)-like protein
VIITPVPEQDLGYVGWMERADEPATSELAFGPLSVGSLGPDLADAFPVVRDALLIDYLPVVVVCLDAEGRAVVVSAGWSDVTGRSAEEELGEGWLQVFDEGAEVQLWVNSVIADGRTASRDVWVRSDRGPRLMRFAGTPRYDNEGRLHSYVLCGTDVTDLVARDDRLAHAARYDALTGLLSRAEFQNEAKRWDCATTVARRPCALLFLDVDNFKAINDMAGHGVGDEVLRLVGLRLQNALPARTVLARYGGDEFAALLVDVTTPAEAAAVADQVLARLSQAISVKGHRLQVTASIGVALTGGDQITGWLERADAALYEAKALGKHAFVVAEGTAPGRDPLSGSDLSATDPPAPSATVSKSASTPFHAAHFYDDDDDLLPALAGYISAGLFRDNVVVIASAEHRRQLRQRLDPDLLAAARGSNRYVELDAAETLSRFMRNGFPDPDLFQMVVGSTILRSTTHQTRVRAYGEMVSLLWAEGNAAATLRLEVLWSDLQRRIPFPLLCAYPMRDFPNEPDNGFDEICSHHTRLLKAG